MNPLFHRFLPVFALSILLVPPASQAANRDDRSARDVRITYVEGDVRLSRGDGKRVDLDRAWEAAEPGESAEQGYALATGTGRAEIAFENGSAVFLAENSLLLFKEVAARGERSVTRITLATGNATFSLSPVAHEYFYLDTPTDTLSVSAPDRFYIRIGAYLDATAFTPQADQGDTIGRPYLPDLYIAKGKTVFFRGGEVIAYRESSRNPVSARAGGAESAESSISPPGSSAFGETGLFPVTPAKLAQPTASSSLPGPQGWIPAVLTGMRIHASPAMASRVPTEWDNWVGARLHQQTVETEAALKASGLSSPVPGLTDLYERGRFFACEPYGTCWEPNESRQPVSESEAAQYPAAFGERAARAESATRYRTYTGATSHFEPASSGLLRFPGRIGGRGFLRLTKSNNRGTVRPLTIARPRSSASIQPIQRHLPAPKNSMARIMDRRLRRRSSPYGEARRTLPSGTRRNPSPKTVRAARDFRRLFQPE